MKGELILFFVFAFFISFVSADSIQQINYSATTSPQSPTFFVQVLKYEPFPVNAGDWFDLWIKVQNIGQDDAKNVRFELKPNYPFSSNDSLVKDYGLVYGTVNAYRVDQTYDAAQVILKYRVRVEDNAASGISNIKLLAYSDYLSVDRPALEFSLPIEIASTKTDFDVQRQASDSRGVSFVVTNVGKNDVSAVTVSMEGNVSYLDSRPASIGDLNVGDFKIAHVSAIPLSKEAMVRIDYTDKAGTRNSVEKSVPLSENDVPQACVSEDSFVKYIFGLAGLFLGILAMLVFRVIKNKR